MILSNRLSIADCSFRKASKSLTALLLLFTFFLLYAARFHAFAEGKPTVTLRAAEDVVHSGAAITLTAELSAPSSDELNIAVSGGSDALSIVIPRGKTSGSLKVNAGEYKNGDTEKYSVSAGTGYTPADNNAAAVTVLPKPQLTFYADHYTASPGQKLSINLKCMNAAALTLPLDVSLRLADGTVIEHFEFGGSKSSYTYKYKLSEDCEIPYSFIMYNEAAKKKATQIPVKITDLNRQKGVFRVDTKEKKIAISFDCGFDNKYTQYILDTLDEYNIKCTFFVTGVFVSGFPDMLQEIHKRGHEIGNHTANHKSLPKLTEEQVYDAVKSVNDRVYKKVGVTPRVMRPPYGSGNFNVHNITRMAGCEVIYWSHDSHDWMPECPAKEIILRATTKLQNGSIVLFHNSAPKTKQTLRPILEKYKKLGYEIVPVSELIYHNYFTIDKMGVQKLKPGFSQVRPADLMKDYTPLIHVTGASSDDASPVSLKLSPVYSEKMQVMSKDDIAKVKKDPSLVQVKYDCGDSVAAPVRQGDKIGTAEFTFGKDVTFTAEVTALEDIAAYEPPADQPVAVSPTDVSSSDQAGVFAGHRLNYILDAIILLCLAAGSLLVFKMSKGK